MGDSFSPEQRQLLLRLSREALVSLARRENPPVPHWVPPELQVARACFVTLRKSGVLRGCVGNIFPREPLAEAVVANTMAAALRDSRFPPVEGQEVPGIRIELSVLTEPMPVAYTAPEHLLRILRPGIDGVVMKFESGISTFLPKVWEQLPDAEPFLEHLARKAGRRVGDWKSSEAEISIYQAETFAETESG